MSDPAVLDRAHLRQISKASIAKDVGSALTRELATGLGQTLEVLDVVERALAQARQKADAAANSRRATEEDLARVTEHFHVCQETSRLVSLDRAALRALLHRYVDALQAIGESTPVRRFAPHEAQRLRRLATEALRAQ